jgi:hypothetical protein
MARSQPYPFLVCPCTENPGKTQNQQQRRQQAAEVRRLKTSIQTEQRTDQTEAKILDCSYLFPPIGSYFFPNRSSTAPKNRTELSVKTDCPPLASKAVAVARVFTSLGKAAFAGLGCEALCSTHICYFF